MITALVICIVMVFAAVLTRALGLPRLNAVSAFTASWVPMLVVSGVFGAVSRGLSELTWLMILTGWVSLVTGTWAGWFLTRLRRSDDAAPPIVIDVIRTRRIHLFLTSGFSVYVLIQIANALPLITQSGGWDVVLSSAGNAYRNASLRLSLEQSQTALTSGSIALSVLSYLTFMGGTVATYTGAVLWRAGYRITGVLPVAIAAALSLVTLQRTSIVLVALLFFFGLAAIRISGVVIPGRERVRATCAHSGPAGRPDGVRRRRAAVASVVLAGALGVFMYYTTEVRNTNSETLFTQQAGEYLVGGVAGLESRNVHGADWAALPGDDPGTLDPAPGMGGYTFSGLWAVLYRLGAPVEPTRVNLDFKPVELFGHQNITNVVTGFGEYYLDFRWAGLVILPLLIGWTTSSLQRGLAGSQRIGRVPAVSYLLTISFWSYFVAWFSDLRQILVAIAGGIVLTWAVRRHPTDRAPSDIESGSEPASTCR